MTQLSDIICLTAIGCLAATALGAYISKQTAKRLIPELRCTQIANWRRFGVTIAIVLPVLQAFALNDLHSEVPDFLVPYLFTAILCYCLCYQIGSYRWRKTFLQESWGLGTMLAFQIRFFLVFYAPILLLLLLPALVAEAGLPWLGVLLGIGLWIWLWQYNPMIAFLLSAKELRNPQLRQRLDELAARSTINTIQWLECGPQGGSFGNAFALAAPAWCTKHAVLITAPMLECCTDHEIEAVCAHEIAHLEDYDAKKQKRIALQFLLPILLASIVFPWIMSINESGRWLGLFAWTFTWIILSRWINRRRLREETGSDRRAFELMSDPLQLAYALTKLYGRLGSPRRVLAAAEIGVTHPSLARRIGLIRRAANSPEIPVPACCLRGLNGGQFTITQDAVHLTLPPAKKKTPLPISIKWENVATILIVPKQKAATLLIQAVDAAKPTSFAIDLKAAAELEPIIQTADHRISSLMAVMRRQQKPKHGLVRFTLVLSLLPILFVTLANPAILLMLLPAWIGCAICCSRSWMLAAGSALLGTSLLTFFAHYWTVFDREFSLIGGAALLIPFGLSLILSAIEMRRDFVAAFPRGKPWLTAAIMLAAVGIATAASSHSRLLIASAGLVIILTPLYARRVRRPRAKIATS